MLAAQREPASSPAAATPEPATAQPAAQSAPPSTGQRPGESADALEARLTERLQALVTNDREKVEAQKRIKEYEERLKKIEGNPLTKRLMDGGTYEDLTKDILEGKLQPPTREAVALTAQEQRIQELAEQLKQYTDREAQRDAEAEHARELADLGDKLKGAAERFPLAASMPHGPKAIASHLRAARERGETPDVGRVIEQFNAAAEKDLEAILATDGGRKWLTAKLKFPASAQQPVQAQQAERAPVADRNGPSAIPQQTAVEPGTRVTRPKSSAERKAAAQRVLREQRDARG